MSSARAMNARLAEVVLPEFPATGDEPVLEPGVHAERYAAFQTRLKSAGADIGVVYGDREHGASMAWLTGFEPRFEEALLIARRGRDPVLLTGPENQGVAAAAPLPADVRLYPPMGLMGQDRSATPNLVELLRDAGIAPGMSVGVCGWKYFSAEENADHQFWMEVPSYLVDTLRKIVTDRGRVFNAGAIFMDPQTGLRAVNDMDELARYEFSACHTSLGVRNVVHSARPGMREYEAAALLGQMGMPLSCHTMMTSGERAWFGLLSPGSRVMQKGDAVTTAYGVQGALNCRAGWLAEGPSDLDPAVQDYVDVLVKPYFEAIVQWLETVGIGLEGGTLDAIIRKRLGDPFFGVKLNPGHLIHLDEWMHTPIAKGSKAKLKSGMALQVDVIPGTGGPYFTTNIEDGIALLDARGRAAFAEKYSSAMERIHLRREFMEDQLGIRLKPECLPFSNIAGWLPPFWLSPNLAMTVK